MYFLLPFNPCLCWLMSGNDDTLHVFMYVCMLCMYVCVAHTYLTKAFIYLYDVRLCPVFMSPPWWYHVFYIIDVWYFITKQLRFGPLNPDTFLALHWIKTPFPLVWLSNCSIWRPIYHMFNNIRLRVLKYLERTLVWDPTFHSCIAPHVSCLTELVFKFVSQISWYDDLG